MRSKLGEAASTGHDIRQSGLNPNGKSDRLNPPALPPITTTITPECPECTSQKVWKDGLRRTKNGNIQRFLCRSCGLRFSDGDACSQSLEKRDVLEERRLKSFQSGSDLAEASMGDLDFFVKKVLDDSALPVGKNVSPHDSSLVTTVGKDLNNLCSNKCNAEYCATKTQGAKNLAAATRTKAAGATTTTEFVDERELFEKWLEKNGYSETTVRYYVSQVTFLAKNQVNLFDPESVKEFISKQQWSRSSKLTICYAYGAFLKMIGLDWKMPRYKPQEQPIWIPTEAEIDTLISATGKRTSIYLQLLKETGMRAGEADSLEWKHVDSGRRIIYVASEKGGTPRTLKVSKELIGRLETLHIKNSSKVFGERSANTMRSTFSRQRKRIAYKMDNPRLMQIHFHTIRHWYATMLYHLTKNPRLVQRRLGHRNLKTTERYIHLEEDVYGNESNEHFICEIVKTAEEARMLIKQGYEFIDVIDGEHLYRKRE